jgi:hypothetical protein
VTSTPATRVPSKIAADISSIEQSVDKPVSRRGKRALPIDNTTDDTSTPNSKQPKAESVVQETEEEAPKRRRVARPRK